jgi:hypothetical protein
MQTSAQMGNMLAAGKYFARRIALAVGLLIAAASEAIAADQAWPVQLEMRVPFEPSAFPSAGQTHLFTNCISPISGRHRLISAVLT